MGTRTPPRIVSSVRLIYMKASDPMQWTGLMNNCRAQAEETILTELINI